MSSSCSDMQVGVSASPQLGLDARPVTQSDQRAAGHQHTPGRPFSFDEASKKQTTALPSPAPCDRVTSLIAGSTAVSVLVLYSFKTWAARIWGRPVIAWQSGRATRLQSRDMIRCRQNWQKALCIQYTVPNLVQRADLSLGTEMTVFCDGDVLAGRDDAVTFLPSRLTLLAVFPSHPTFQPHGKREWKSAGLVDSGTVGRWTKDRGGATRELGVSSGPSSQILDPASLLF